MNIEKVKEALELAIKLNKSAWSHHNQLFYEAIAELEKPAEDAEQAECDIFMMIAHAKLNGTPCVLRGYLQQYAESYHAKLCVDCGDSCCRARETCEDREPRFPETRSGVTTDVDK